MGMLNRILFITLFILTGYGRAEQHSVSTRTGDVLPRVAVLCERRNLNC